MRFGSVRGVGVSAVIGMLMMISVSGPVLEASERDALRYAAAIRGINESHVERPGTSTEAALAEKIPAAARSALRRVLDAAEAAAAGDRGGAAIDREEVAAALVICGEAALDLAVEEDFRAVRERLVGFESGLAAELGDAVFRPRFVVRGIGEFEAEYLEDFADLIDCVLDAYDEVFGFAEWSKVPGKKLRFRVHLEDRITRPPHFAPEHPYHSEVDFPVVESAGFRSPTRDGHFLFYGLCHELGHVIAMWGDRDTMEDHHAWAHYTGVVIVEHLSAAAKAPEAPTFLKNALDLRWRSLTVERELPENRVSPSLESRAGVMALLIAVHDAAGTQAIGAALNRLDSGGRVRRINHVRYYGFDDFERALAEVVTDSDARKALREAFP